MSEEELFSPVGADVSDDAQQLGMLSVYKPDTKAPTGIAKEVKSENAKHGIAVFLLHCSYVYAKTSHVQNRGSAVYTVNGKYA